eukprot:CAMPEP_0180646464 /NCGR_PEP_ID=MMETSP1037_2-20121125/49661_1 /TAXON_ID=632150 /ORGANISM="Azadinium spinosum, Strain 3D9" /LENGTH=95 /DNA_ID=CAMNT_0022670639 /DNA_START=44 /DNA_END=329 /DNA_ORIENTATION=+
MDALEDLGIETEHCATHRQLPRSRREEAQGMSEPSGKQREPHAGPDVQLETIEDKLVDGELQGTGGGSLKSPVRGSFRHASNCAPSTPADERNGR